MRAEVVYSPSNNVKEAYLHLLNQLEQIDFEPNFLLLFLTGGVWKNYRVFTELFKNRFPYAKMLGCTVEGYLVGDEIWTRGVAALLGDFDGKVEVFWAKDKTASKTAEKLGEQIGRGWDAILLMFPAFYFPRRFGLLKAFFNDKRYYIIFKNKKDLKEKEKVLEEYSKYLESKFIFPIDKMLKVLARRTNCTQIIGMNLVPLEAASNTPLILANYENIGRGAAAICFKGRINVIFHDVFPERGNDYDETLKIIEDYFLDAEIVKIMKKRITIGEINGTKPVDFLKIRKSGFKSMTQEDILKKIETGKLQMATPYVLAFISQKTHGSALLGLESFPINLYPSLFSVDEFYNTAVFCGELFRGGLRTFGKIFDMKKFNSFDFFIIDHNTIMSYGGGIHKFIDLIKEKSHKYLGIFSSNPSAHITNLDKKYLSEIDVGIYVNSSGTATILEFV